MMNRRSALAAVAGGVLAAPAFLRTVNAQGTQKVSLTMSWLPEGTFAYVYVAKAMNFWKDKGLDVDIARGYGSLNAAQALYAGRFDFGMATVDTTLILASKNVDLRCLALFDYIPTMGVAVLDSSPVKTPKDLEGKTVGQTAASSESAFFPFFCKKNGADYSKIKIANIDAKVRNQALVEGKIDAITGLATSIVPAVTATGAKMRYLLYSNYGIDLYGNINLLARPETIEKSPDLCKTFTQGFLEGLKFTLTKPAEAQDVFIKSVPELAMTNNAAGFAKLGMDLQRFTAVSIADTKVHGVGWGDQKKLQAMSDSVMQYEASVGGSKPNIPLIFSNRFVGNVKYTNAEWEAIQKNTPSIDSMLKRSA